MSLPRISFEKAVLLLVFACIVYFISRYDMCFQDGEVITKYMSRALKNGPDFTFADIKLAMDVDSLDGDSRPRIISYLSYILALKTRLVLWDFIPPHPSLTPVWLFTLCIGPFLFFRFLEIELRNRAVACVGLAVYCVSTGFLSGVTMLFHAAKPLANAVIITAFYLSAKIDNEVRSQQADHEKHAIPPLFWLGYFFLFLVAPFVDETALFAYAIPLFWCPYYFWPRNFPGDRISLLRNWTVYIVPLFIAAVIIFKVLPSVTQLASGHKFDFISYLHRSAHFIGKLDIPHLIWNSMNLFTPALLPWSIAGVTTPVALGPKFSIVALVIVAGGILICTRMIRQRQIYWKLYGKLCILIGLFIMFHTLILVFHEAELVATGYYYGAIFSVLFASIFAVVYADLSQRCWTVAAQAVLVWVVFISAMNFVAINAEWIRLSNFKVLLGLENLPTYEKFGDWDPLKKRVSAFWRSRSGYPSIADQYYFEDMRGDPEAPFADNLAIWRSWRRGDSNFLATGEIDLRNQWLMLELMLKRDPALRWIPFKPAPRPVITGKDYLRIYVEGFKKWLNHRFNLNIN